MNNTPCINCTQRTVGCHATCEGYKAFASSLAEKKRIKAEYIAKTGGAAIYVVDMQNKIRRANGKTQYGGGF